MKNLKNPILLFTFIPLFLFLISPLFAQVNQKDANGFKQGAWQKSYPEGKLKYEGNFKNDVPIGLFKYYYPDGKLEATNNYFNDGKYASAHMYYPDGKIKALGLYNETKKDSLWKYFNKNEVLTAEEYYVKGVKHGIWKTYYDNAKLADETNWNNGKKEGKWNQYYEDGSLKQEAMYINDKREGDFKIYFPENKQLSIEGKYKDDVKTGNWFHYLQNGLIEKVERFKGGILDNCEYMNTTIKEYYKNDIPKSSIKYVNGKKQGDWNEYYEAGEWKMKTVKKETGEEDEEAYLDGQKLKVHGKYVNGLLEGDVIYYTPEGKVQKTENYKNGVLKEK